MIIALVAAYNEEKNIGSVVRDLFEHVDHVVVVDDGSQDGTPHIASKAGATVFTHVINRGQGAALQTGHEHALRLGAQYVIHFDGDGQFDVQDIPRALTHMKEVNADILLGSRFMDNRSHIPFAKRNILFPLGRLVNRISGAPSITDVHNGFRILNERALSAIVLRQDGMAHATEILQLIPRHDLTHVEFPVKVRYDHFGQGMMSGIRIIKDLIMHKVTS